MPDLISVADLAFYEEYPSRFLDEMGYSPTSGATTAR